MTEDSTGDGRLLLGWCGWPHPAWLGDYFPDDLPEDWQLAYFSNDADALYLNQTQWQSMDCDEMEQAVDDLPEHFRFYLRAAVSDVAHPLIGVLGPHLGGLLLDQVPTDAAGLPFFGQVSPSQWVASASQEYLVFAEAGTDLRAHRAVIEGLPPATRALLFDGDAADPAGLGELRMLADMLGS